MVKQFLTSRLGKNIVTNYLTVIWMGALSLALIPFYLRELGPEQWGIVAICMAFQGFLVLLDAGLGQIMPRDVARVADDIDAQSHVFAVFDRAYLILSGSGFILGQMAIPWLIENWFNKSSGAIGETELALRLVLVQFFFQFANNANTGLWSGLQKQVLANFRQCIFGTCKHIGALTLIFHWQPNAIAYLAPFTLVSYVEWQLNRNFVKHELGSSLASAFVTLKDIKTLARQAGVLAFGVIIGMVVSQIDRIILSKSINITEYGHYIIVANFGLAFMQLQYPLMRAFFPRIVQMETKQNGNKSEQAIYLSIGIIFLCVLPCTIAATFASWILTIWIGDDILVKEGTLPLQCILSAVAINAIYHIVYQKMIARSYNRLIALINIVTLIVTAIALWTMAQKLGILAGGFAWLLSSLLQFALGWTGYIALRKI